MSGESQETLREGIALSFELLRALLPPHWCEYFLAPLFSQAGLESLGFICVP